MLSSMSYLDVLPSQGVGDRMERQDLQCTTLCLIQHIAWTFCKEHCSIYSVGRGSHS